MTETLHQVSPYDRVPPTEVVLPRPVRLWPFLEEYPGAKVIGSFEVSRQEQVEGSAPHLLTNVEVSKTLTVVALDENQILHNDFAEWLVFRANDDPDIEALTPDDLVRFKDVQEVQQNFLNDKDGRRLYLLVDEEKGSVEGSLWLHPLQGSFGGNDMVTEAEKSLDVPTQNLATLAIRINNETRGFQASGKFLEACLVEYYKHHKYLDENGEPDDSISCLGVIVRVARSNVHAVKLFDRMYDYGAVEAGFSSLGSRGGVLYYGHLRDRALMPDHLQPDKS